MKVLGLMSGTSADGIDIALCDITGAPPDLTVTMMAGRTLPYPDDLRDLILTACDPVASNARVISQLDFALSHFVANSIHYFFADVDHFAGVDLIGSHGQTIWHEVADDGRVTATLQVGTASILAEEHGTTVISNFRQRDVAAGGQGAPLTAYVDFLLLRHADKWRAVQNIGGMGNVTIVPPLTAPDSQLITFDTGPGNVLIDSAMRLITDGELNFDMNGEFANRGNLDLDWLDALLQHPYYVRQPPKTTGRELFSPTLAAQYIADGRERDLSDDDIIATLTALTAYSIFYAIDDYSPHLVDEVVIGGGGSNNPALMAALRDLFDEVPVIIHEDIGHNSDHKEAMAFAVLAYETWHHRPTTLPQQTGARHASILGDITPGANFIRLAQATWSVNDDD